MITFDPTIPRPEFKHTDVPLNGHRKLTSVLGWSRDSFQVRYGNWLLWVPARALVQHSDKSFSVPAWAVADAREKPTAEYLGG